MLFCSPSLWVERSATWGLVRKEQRHPSWVHLPLSLHPDYVTMGWIQGRPAIERRWMFRCCELQALWLLGDFHGVTLEEDLATRSSSLAGESHGQRSLQRATAHDKSPTRLNNCRGTHSPWRHDTFIKLIPAPVLSLTGWNVYIHTRNLLPMYPNVILKGVW